MGVKGLCEFLKNTCKNAGVYSYTSVTDFINSEKNKEYETCIELLSSRCGLTLVTIKTMILNKPYKIAIDTHLYLAKYKRVGNLTGGFLNQLVKSYSQNIKPCHVFDGKSPEDKKSTTEKRNKKKQKQVQISHTNMQDSERIKKNIENMDTEQAITYLGNYVTDLKKKRRNIELIELIEKLRVYIKKNPEIWDSELFTNFTNNYKFSYFTTSEDIYNLKVLFQTLGVDYIEATGEADDTMVDLYNKHQVDACLSDDMDFLPKGCQNLIQISGDGVIQYSLPDILKNLKMTYEQFVDFCILAGTDYYNKFSIFIPKYELYKLFMQYPSIELFIDYYAKKEERILLHKQGFCNVRKHFIHKQSSMNEYSLVKKIQTNEFFTVLLENNIRIENEEIIKNNIRIMNRQTEENLIEFTNKTSIV